jgi:hypothetical protein
MNATDEDHPTERTLSNELPLKPKLTKEAFMAKWEKLSPRAKQELLDLAKEQIDLEDNMSNQD